jgi:two-component system, HptB-dependent secretion and biofilm response regulator
MNKILIVDDIESNRKLLRQMLSALKVYDVVEASNGLDAISVFESEDPDLILMDINMPELNGYESATRIKKLTGFNYVPIIFVTALNTEITHTNALFSGGDDYLSKPFNIEVLESKMKAHLRIRDLNKQLNEKNIQLAHEQELIEHFFESALQQSFINENIIKYHMSPMSTFNGDLLLIERGPQGGMYLLMGDFTGHGLTAAMGTLPAAMIFFKMAKRGLSVSEIVRELNYQLNKLMPVGMFLAASLLELNASGDILSVWMGGMPESYWLGLSGELKDVIHSRHMPLGILKDKDFDSEVSIYSVEKEDKIYLYSDGLTEAANSIGEMYGSARLKDVMINNKENRFESILNEFQSYTDVHDQSDDITLVEMTCREVPVINENNYNTFLNEYSFPWSLSMSLTESDMRRDDPVSNVSNMLGSMPVLSKHKGVLHVLLSEMYSNSLEHSILGLKSYKKDSDEDFERYYSERESRLLKLVDAVIAFDFELFLKDGKSLLKLKITDNGKGYKDHVSNDSDDLLHGRGLDIINSFCKEVVFSSDGQSLEVIFCI